MRATCAREAKKENIKIRQKLREVTSALKAKDDGAEQGKLEHVTWVTDLPRLKSDLDALLPTLAILSGTCVLLQNEAAQNKAKRPTQRQVVHLKSNPKTQHTRWFRPECDWDGQL